MAQSLKISGKCLCGAVTFTAEAAKPEVAVCHCNMCQRQVAGPYMAIECVPGSLKIAGEGDVSYYKSSEWARRGFCKSCGSALFWRSFDGKFEVVSVGALEDKSALRMATEIFIDEKPGYYDFANKTHRMTGSEFIAAISGMPKAD